MQVKYHSTVEDFSLTKGGLFYHLLLRLGLQGTSKKDYLRRSLLLVSITWLPLFILTALQGLAWGNKVEVTFLKDFADHAKFLIVIPLLVFAEGSVDSRLKEMTSHLFSAGILNDNDIPAYNAIRKSITKLSESLIADIVILLLVVIFIITRWINRPVESSYWILLPGDNGSSVSWAGIWFFFSLSIFIYLLLRWLWRWITWTIYLKKIAGLPLKLNVAHPDLAGGIGFLGMPPSPFLQISLALSIIISTVIAGRIIFADDSLPQYYVAIGGFVVFSLLLNMLPLLVFIKPLAFYRHKGIFIYSTLIQEHHRNFEKKWVYKNENEPMPDSGDDSSLSDFNSSFDTVMKMQIVPFNVKIMLSTCIIALLPMVPLLAFEYNLLDIVQQIFGMLL